MFRRILSAIMIACIFFNTTSMDVIAFDANSTTDQVLDEAAAIAAGSTRTVNDVVAQYKFNGPTGHGFAAERGNNLVDRIRGNNAVVVGDNNVKNGPDRIITRRGKVTYIQDKYYSTASNSINACFEDGKYRYLDPDGNPMQVEVPKDQYADAVAEMKKKIAAGEVPGVTDPEEAEKYVREGPLTYKQAANLAKAGTIESLTYDAVNGCVAATVTFGISTLVNYGVRRIQGADREDAIKDSAIDGLKTGGLAFLAAIIAGQLSKTAVIDIFKPTSEALVEALGEDFAKTLLRVFGKEAMAEQGGKVTVTTQAAKLIRSEVLVATVTLIVFSIPDAISLFRGRISKKQFVKNFAVSAIAIAAGSAGYVVGGALGNLVVPGVGTVPGAIVGSLLFGIGGGFAADKIADYITEDDADEMYAIFENRFAQNCQDYLVTESEANNIVTQLNGKLTEEAFKDMYASKDREKYVDDMLEPLFEAEVKKRGTIGAPTEEEIRYALKDELQDVVFIH